MKPIKNFLCFILITLAALQIQAQNIDWQWAINDGGTEGEGIGAILADHEGNTYVTGNFRGSDITLGGVTLTNGTGWSMSSLFLIKFNSDGEALWYKNGNNIQYNNLAIDEDGNLYATAGFRNTITLGNDTFTAAWGEWSYLLVKFDTAGSVVWAHQIEAPFLELSIDGDGNIYGAGLYSTDSIRIGGTTVYMRDNVFRDYYLAKFNAAGEFQWLRNYGGAYDIYYNVDMTTDGSGNVYVAGGFHQDTTYDIANDTTFFVITDTVGTDFFIAKYDGAGNLLKFETGGAEGLKGDHINDIATGPNGDVYISGSFAGARLHFKNTTLVGYAPCANYFLFRLDSTLNLIWEQGGGNNYNNTGDYITVDTEGNVYVGGSFANTFHLDDHLFLSHGATDFFVTKYDVSGNMLYATVAGGGLFDVLYGLTTDPEGNVYVSGLAGSDTFALGNFNITNHPGNGFDIFIAKLSVTMETGINTAAAAANVSVYPNPVTSQLTIQNNESAFSEFALYNVTGKQILFQQLSGGTNRIDLSGIAENVYFYKITSATRNTVTGKIVKL